MWRFEAGKILRYVRAASTTSHIAQYASVRANISTFGLGGSPVVAPSTLLVGTAVEYTSGVTDMLLGVAENATIAAGNFGWITVYGPCTVAMTTGIVPLSALVPSSNTGILQIAATCSFNAAAIAVQSGLSAGSAAFITVF